MPTSIFPRLNYALFLALAGSALLATTAHANEISLNFSGNQFTSQTVVDSAGPAGALGARQQGNWNNIDTSPNNAQTGTVGSPTAGAGALIDNSGAATTLVTAFGSDFTNANTYTTSGPTTEDSQLLSGFIGINGGPRLSVSLAFSDIPYAQYSVYVYFGSTGSNHQGFISDGATTYYYTTDAYNSGIPFPGYVATTSTNPSVFTSSDYAVFSKETAQNLTILTSIAAPGPGVGVFGFQIVQTPEPASLGLLATASLTLLARRHRRRA